MINKKLGYAVSLHRNGAFEEAKKNYKEILEIEPLHPDANHNLGVLEVYDYNSEKALPLLRTALNENNKIEQYWFSYIDALINTNRIEKAKSVILKAKRNNLDRVKVRNLDLRLMSPCERYKRNEFYQSNDGNYLDFLKILHKKKYETYFEIGSRTGDSLALSNSPSVAIDPFFQLKNDPIKNKEFCLLFQETSDHFFDHTFKHFKNLRCQLGFIDGMHLFENALKDFINLAKISSEKSLFLIHDILPWSQEMTTRDYKKIPVGQAWTGDVWKLIPIFKDSGLTRNIRLLTLAPSGLLAVYNPKKEIICELERNYQDICNKWIDKILDKSHLKDIYHSKIFDKPENFTKFLQKHDIGENKKVYQKKWVSH